MSAPKSASKSAQAENTLLGSCSQNEAVKQAAEVPADVAKVLKNVFDGVWSKGAIAGDSLTWADGTISFISVDEVSRVLEVNFKGTVFTGGLYDDGDKIHWSDGDIWDRCGADAGEVFKLSDDLLRARDGPESIDPVAHTSQANKNGELVQFAGAPLPSIPEAAKPSPEKKKNQVDAGSKPVEASPTDHWAHSANNAHTRSQSLARITGPDSANNDRMFADSRKASPTQGQPRKEKNWCCC